MSIIGIQNAHRGAYIPYYKDKRIRAIERLERADEIVTYNGNHSDISELNKLSQELRKVEFNFSGTHIDMREKCWPNIWGSNLLDTFSKHLNSNKQFSDDYEGSNRADVYMTLMLWKYWKKYGKFT